MRRFACFFAAFALLTAAHAAASKPVGPLRVTTLDGKPLDIISRPGWKVVTFWSVACPCVRDCETLSLIPLAQKYKGRVQFFAVASNAADLSSDRKILAQNASFHHLPYPVVLDKTAAAALGARTTPQTFLISPSGQIVFNGPPDDSWTVKSQTGKSGMTQSYLADALTAALAGKLVTRARVKALGCSITR